VRGLSGSWRRLTGAARAAAGKGGLGSLSQISIGVRRSTNDGSGSAVGALDKTTMLFGELEPEQGSKVETCVV